MKILDQLVSEIDTIERDNEWAAKFISDIEERISKNPGYRLSGKQFEKLNQLHQEYILHWSKK